jgi:hypothetical protein
MTNHKSEITALVWGGDERNTRLFSGDESGVVYSTPVGVRLKSSFFSSNTTDPEYLYNCEK